MYSSMILFALCNLLYLSLHVTGSGSFPKPLSAKAEAECLRRVREGQVQLGGLKLGKWRRLTDEEVALLKAL